MEKSWRNFVRPKSSTEKNSFGTGFKYSENPRKRGAVVINLFYLV